MATGSDAVAHARALMLFDAGSILKIELENPYATATERFVPSEATAPTSPRRRISPFGALDGSGSVTSATLRRSTSCPVAVSIVEIVFVRGSATRTRPGP